MPPKNSSDLRKIWTQQQTELRKLVSSKATFGPAIQLFLRQHAATHTAKISAASNWSLEDEALAGLSGEQIRACPVKEVNSIAWLLWHVTRIEDMTMTALVFERPQVILSGGWQARLGLPLLDCGAGMSAAEVQAFSAQVNVEGLLAYRAAVGRSTQDGVCQLEPANLKEIISSDALATLVSEGSISAQAPWLAEFYARRPKGFFLTRTATSHNFLHVNQAARLGAKYAKS